jgi:hypothetical protein
MRPGLVYPSYGAEVVWTAVTGTWDANYPLANVADLLRSTKVARASAVNSARTITGIWPVARTIQALAFIGHNYTGSVSTVRVRLFSDNNPDPVGNAAAIVSDTTTPWWPSPAVPVSGYAAVLPVILSAVVTARSAHIVMGNNMATTADGGSGRACR